MTPGEHIAALRDALEKLRERYVALVNCGACVIWNLETEDGVRAARKALALPAPPDGWRPMEEAPRDGTEIQAEIPGHGSDNIIAWTSGLLGTDGRSCGGWQFTRGQEPPDSWTDGTCWEVNEDGNQSVQPTAWKAIKP